MRLEAEAGDAELPAAVRELEVGDAARREVGRNVDVRIEAAADQLACTCRGDGMVSQVTHPNKIVNNLVAILTP